MQIILLEKLINLGQLGDVVKVKDGYARNFLIPRGKAKRATPSNLAEFEGRRAVLEKAQADVHAAAIARASTVDGLALTITQKAGADGRLFGSVTNADVAEALRAQGFEVEKSQVHMPSGPLKMIGDHPVTVQLHTDVKVDVTVSVLGDNS